MIFCFAITASPPILHISIRFRLKNHDALSTYAEAGLSHGLKRKRAVNIYEWCIYGIVQHRLSCSKRKTPPWLVRFFPFLQDSLALRGLALRTAMSCKATFVLVFLSSALRQ